MKWIEKSRDLIIEQSKLITPFFQRMQDPENVDSLLEILGPVADGPIAPGVEKLVVERMLELLGEECLMLLRRSADVYIELGETYKGLGETYKRLGKANEDEVEPLLA